ncbi:PEP-CTERM sorting domain-containing protein [Desulfobacter curvatus]|uniref:PEP-CTERM sorting domain-containing protein n=1 Tax=Desulfobacter curvatus TaxID=2290 RepID=UPI00037199B7|nr:PEP-CTERM sorting domain-containing protein [Desulfobacter curvatus]
MKKLLLALFVASIFITSPVSATILEGDFLRVGVGTGGGLIDDDFIVGIDYDSAGNGAWTTYDVLKPGSPFQFNSIGVNGSWAASGYENGNNFSATTTETSAGTTLSTSTTGAYGGLSYSQYLYFDETSGVIHFTITLANITDSILEDVVFATGFDPDQDVYAGGSTYTTNTIESDRVVAYGSVTGWGTAIVGDGVMTISSFWNQNPYALATTSVNDGSGDYTINMGWDLGDMAAGAVATINFDYALGTDSSGHTDPAPIPEPATVLLFGLGILGIAGASRKKKA